MRLKLIVTCELYVAHTYANLHTIRTHTKIRRIRN